MLKKHKLMRSLSLFLALVLLATSIPMTALAAGVDEVSVEETTDAVEAQEETKDAAEASGEGASAEAEDPYETEPVSEEVPEESPEGEPANETAEPAEAAGAARNAAGAGEEKADAVSVSITLDETTGRWGSSAVSEYTFKDTDKEGNAITGAEKLAESRFDELNALDDDGKDQKISVGEDYKDLLQANLYIYTGTGDQKKLTPIAEAKATIGAWTKDTAAADRAVVVKFEKKASVKLVYGNYGDPDDFANDDKWGDFNNPKKEKEKEISASKEMRLLDARIFVNSGTLNDKKDEFYPDSTFALGWSLKGHTAEEAAISAKTDITTDDAKVQEALSLTKDANNQGQFILKTKGVEPEWDAQKKEYPAYGIPAEVQAALYLAEDVNEDGTPKENAIPVFETESLSVKVTPKKTITVSKTAENAYVNFTSAAKEAKDAHDNARYNKSNEGLETYQYTIDDVFDFETVQQEVTALLAPDNSLWVMEITGGADSKTWNGLGLDTLELTDYNTESMHVEDTKKLVETGTGSFEDYDLQDGEIVYIDEKHEKPKMKTIYGDIYGMAQWTILNVYQQHAGKSVSVVPAASSSLQKDQNNIWTGIKEGSALQQLTASLLDEDENALTGFSGSTEGKTRVQWEWTVEDSNHKNITADVLFTDAEGTKPFNFGEADAAKNNVKGKEAYTGDSSSVYFKPANEGYFTIQAKLQYAETKEQNSDYLSYDESDEEELYVGEDLSKRNSFGLVVEGITSEGSVESNSALDIVEGSTLGMLRVGSGNGNGPDSAADWRSKNTNWRKAFTISLKGAGDAAYVAPEAGTSVKIKISDPSVVDLESTEGFGGNKTSGYTKLVEKNATQELAFRLKAVEPQGYNANYPEREATITISSENAAFKEFSFKVKVSQKYLVTIGAADSRTTTQANADWLAEGYAVMDDNKAAKAAQGDKVPFRNPIIVDAGSDLYAIAQGLDASFFNTDMITSFRSLKGFKDNTQNGGYYTAGSKALSADQTLFAVFESASDPVVRNVWGKAGAAIDAEAAAAQAADPTDMIELPKKNGEIDVIRVGEADIGDADKNETDKSDAYTANIIVNTEGLASTDKVILVETDNKNYITLPEGRNENNRFVTGVVSKDMNYTTFSVTTTENFGAALRVDDDLTIPVSVKIIRNYTEPEGDAAAKEDAIAAAFANAEEAGWSFSLGAVQRYVVSLPAQDPDTTVKYKENASKKIYLAEDATYGDLKAELEAAADKTNGRFICSGTKEITDWTITVPGQQEPMAISALGKKGVNSLPGLQDKLNGDLSATANVTEPFVTLSVSFGENGEYDGKLLYGVNSEPLSYNGNDSYQLAKGGKLTDQMMGYNPSNVTVQQIIKNGIVGLDEKAGPWKPFFYKKNSTDLVRIDPSKEAFNENTELVVKLGVNVTLTQADTNRLDPSNIKTDTLPAATQGDTDTAAAPKVTYANNQAALTVLYGQKIPETVITEEAIKDGEGMPELSFEGWYNGNGRIFGKNTIFNEDVVGEESVSLTARWSMTLELKDVTSTPDTNVRLALPENAQTGAQIADVWRVSASKPRTVKVLLDETDGDAILENVANLIDITKEYTYTPSGEGAKPVTSVYTAKLYAEKEGTTEIASELDSNMMKGLAGGAIYVRYTEIKNADAIEQEPFAIEPLTEQKKLRTYWVGDDGDGYLGVEDGNLSNKDDERQGKRPVHLEVRLTNSAGGPLDGKTVTWSGKFSDGTAVDDNKTSGLVLINKRLGEWVDVDYDLETPDVWQETDASEFTSETNDEGVAELYVIPQGKWEIGTSLTISAKAGTNLITSFTITMGHYSLLTIVAEEENLKESPVTFNGIRLNKLYKEPEKEDETGKVVYDDDGYIVWDKTSYNGMITLPVVEGSNVGTVLSWIEQSQEGVNQLIFEVGDDQVYDTLLAGNYSDNEQKYVEDWKLTDSYGKVLHVLEENESGEFQEKDYTLKAGEAASSAYFKTGSEFAGAVFDHDLYATPHYEEKGMTLNLVYTENLTDASGDPVFVEGTKLGGLESLNIPMNSNDKYVFTEEKREAVEAMIGAPEGWHAVFYKNEEAVDDEQNKIGKQRLAKLTQVDYKDLAGLKENEEDEAATVYVGLQTSVELVEALDFGGDELDHDFGGWVNVPVENDKQSPFYGRKKAEVNVDYGQTLADATMAFDYAKDKISVIVVDGESFKIDSANNNNLTLMGWYAFDMKKTDAKVPYYDYRGSAVTEDTPILTAGQVLAPKWGVQLTLMAGIAQNEDDNLDMFEAYPNGNFRLQKNENDQNYGVKKVWDNDKKKFIEVEGVGVGYNLLSAGDLIPYNTPVGSRLDNLSLKDASGKTVSLDDILKAPEGTGVEYEAVGWSTKKDETAEQFVTGSYSFDAGDMDLKARAVQNLTVYRVYYEKEFDVKAEIRNAGYVEGSLNEKATQNRNTASGKLRVQGERDISDPKTNSRYGFKETRLATFADLEDALDQMITPDEDYGVIGWKASQAAGSIKEGDLIDPATEFSKTFNYLEVIPVFGREQVEVHFVNDSVVNGAGFIASISNYTGNGDNDYGKLALTRINDNTIGAVLNPEKGFTAGLSDNLVKALVEKTPLAISGTDLEDSYEFFGWSFVDANGNTQYIKTGESFKDGKSGSEEHAFWTLFAGAADQNGMVEMKAEWAPKNITVAFTLGEEATAENASWTGTKIMKPDGTEDKDFVFVGSENDLTTGYFVKQYDAESITSTVVRWYWWYSTDYDDRLQENVGDEEYGTYDPDDYGIDGYGYTRINVPVPVASPGDYYAKIGTLDEKRISDNISVGKSGREFWYLLMTKPGIILGDESDTTASSTYSMEVKESYRNTSSETPAGLAALGAVYCNARVKWTFELGDMAEEATKAAKLLVNNPIEEDDAWDILSAAAENNVVRLWKGQTYKKLSEEDGDTEKDLLEKAIKGGDSIYSHGWLIEGWYEKGADGKPDLTKPFDEMEQAEKDKTFVPLWKTNVRIYSGDSGLNDILFKQDYDTGYNCEIVPMTYGSSFSPDDYVNLPADPRLRLAGWDTVWYPVFTGEETDIPAKADKDNTIVLNTRTVTDDLVFVPRWDALVTLTVDGTSAIWKDGVKNEALDGTTSEASGNTRTAVVRLGDTDILSEKLKDVKTKANADVIASWYGNNTGSLGANVYTLTYSAYSGLDANRSLYAVAAARSDTITLTLNLRGIEENTYEVGNISGQNTVTAIVKDDAEEMYALYDLLKDQVELEPADSAYTFAGFTYTDASGAQQTLASLKTRDDKGRITAWPSGSTAAKGASQVIKGTAAKLANGTYRLDLTVEYEKTKLLVKVDAGDGKFESREAVEGLKLENGTAVSYSRYYDYKEDTYREYVYWYEYFDPETLRAAIDAKDMNSIAQTMTQWNYGANWEVLDWDSWMYPDDDPAHKVKADEEGYFYARYSDEGSTFTARYAVPEIAGISFYDAAGEEIKPKAKTVSIKTGDSVSYKVHYTPANAEKYASPTVSIDGSAGHLTHDAAQGLITATKGGFGPNILNVSVKFLDDNNNVKKNASFTTYLIETVNNVEEEAAKQMGHFLYGTGDSLVVILNDYYFDSSVKTLDQLEFHESSEGGYGMASVAGNSLTWLYDTDGDGIKENTPEEKFYGQLTWAATAGAGSHAAKAVKLADYKNSAASIDVDVEYLAYTKDVNGIMTTVASYTATIPVTFVTVDYELKQAADSRDYILAGDKTNYVHYQLTPVYTGEESAVDSITKDYEWGYTRYGTDVHEGTMVTSAQSYWTFSPDKVGNAAGGLFFDKDGSDVRIYLTEAGQKAVKKKTAVKVKATYGKFYSAAADIFLTTGAFGMDAASIRAEAKNAAGKTTAVGFSTPVGGNNLGGSTDTEILNYEGTAFMVSELLPNMQTIEVSGFIANGTKNGKGSKLTVKPENTAMIKVDSAEVSRYSSTEDEQFKILLSVKKAGQTIVTVTNNDDYGSSFKLVVRALDASLGVFDVNGTPVSAISHNTAFDMTVDEDNDKRPDNNDYSIEIAPVDTLAVEAANAGGVEYRVISVSGDTDYVENLKLSEGKLEGGRKLTFSVKDSAFNVNTKQAIRFKAQVRSVNADSMDAVEVPFTLNVSTAMPRVSAKLDALNLAYVNPEAALTLTNAEQLEFIRVKSAVNGNGNAMTTDQFELDGLEYYKTAALKNASERSVAVSTAYQYNFTGAAVGSEAIALRVLDQDKGSYTANAKNYPKSIVLEYKLAKYGQVMELPLSVKTATKQPTVKVSTPAGAKVTLYPNLEIMSGYVNFTATADYKKTGLKAFTRADDWEKKARISFADAEKAKASRIFTLTMDRESDSDSYDYDWKLYNRVYGWVEATVSDNARAELMSATNAEAFGKGLMYSDSIYRGIPVKCSIGYDPNSTKLSFTKTGTLQLNRQWAGDFAETSFGLAGGGSIDKTYFGLYDAGSSSTLKENLDCELTPIKAAGKGADLEAAKKYLSVKASVGSKVWIDVSFNQDALNENGSVSDALKPGTYTYQVTAKPVDNANVKLKEFSQTITVKVIDVAPEKCVSFKKTGALDVFNRTSVYNGAGNLTMVATLKNVNPNNTSISDAAWATTDPAMLKALNENFAIGNVYSTSDPKTGKTVQYVAISIKKNAPDLRLKKKYDMRLQLTLSGNNRKISVLPASQAGLNSIGITQKGYSFKLLDKNLMGKLADMVDAWTGAPTTAQYNAAIKAATSAKYTLSGSANTPKNGIGLKPLAVIGSPKYAAESPFKFNGNDIYHTAGLANAADKDAVNHRISAIVADSAQFKVQRDDTDDGATFSIIPARILPKGNYRVRLYLYPEGCANDTAAKLVTYTISVE